MPEQHVGHVVAGRLNADMRRLPADIPPMVIVQHMPKGFTQMYADRLNPWPMPVMMMPTILHRTTSAMEWNMASTDGRCPLTFSPGDSPSRS